MQDGVKLERKTKDELKQIAQGLGIEKISALKKDEIIALIREDVYKRQRYRCSRRKLCMQLFHKFKNTV